MAKKKKEKQKRISEPISINLDPERIKCLDRLAKITATNRSNVIRILIPSANEITAAEEIALWTQQQIRTLEPLGSLASAKIGVMVGYRFAFSNFLAKVLRKDVDLQLRAVSAKAENAKERYQALLKLFIAWIRAKSNCAGYRFVDINIKVQKRIMDKEPFIKYKAALGPPDGFEYKKYSMLRHGKPTTNEIFEAACKQQENECQQMMQEAEDQQTANLLGDFWNRYDFWH